MKGDTDPDLKELDRQAQGAPPIGHAAPRGHGEFERVEQPPRTVQHNQLLGRIESDFTYHAPKDGQPEAYALLRGQAKALARAIVELVPPGREQSTALTRLEEAVMHANAGIARHG
jgi:hypothetical protein